MFRDHRSLQVMLALLTAAALVAAAIACSGDEAASLPTPSASQRPGVLPAGALAIKNGSTTSHRTIAPGETGTDSTARLGAIGSLTPRTVTTPLGTPVIPTCETLVVAYQWAARPEAAADRMKITVKPEGGQVEELQPGPTGFGLTGCAEFTIENRSSEVLTIDIRYTAGVLE